MLYNKLYCTLYGFCNFCNPRKQPEKRPLRFQAAFSDGLCCWVGCVAQPRTRFRILGKRADRLRGRERVRRLGRHTLRKSRNININKGGCTR